MIRSLRAADVAALLLFLGKSPTNEARVRDRFNTEGRGLALAFPLLKGCLISGDKQQGFVYTRRGLIRGLICLRSCDGIGAWEIEHLFLASGHEECCLGLLERLGSAGDEMGVERLFLRLDPGSPLVETAQKAGFDLYLTEFLYRLGEEWKTESTESPFVPRPKSSADEYDLFRLYSSVVPLQVRKVEGMTFREWRQSRDRGVAREFVFEDGGEIRAWLQVRLDGKARQLDMVTDSEAGELSCLVDQCLSVFGGRKPIYCLAPEFQQQLRNILEERGFRQVAEYSCFSKQFLVRVHEPQLVPLRA